MAGDNEVLNDEWFSTAIQAQIVINQRLMRFNHVCPHHALNVHPPVPKTSQITGAQTGWTASLLDAEMQTGKILDLHEQRPMKAKSEIPRRKFLGYLAALPTVAMEFTTIGLTQVDFDYWFSINIDDEIITPLHFGVDLDETVTDQSAKLQAFFDYLSADTRRRGLIWGKARGQNIRLMSGIRCHSFNFRLYVPDTKILAHPVAGFSATFGYYNGEALTGTEMTGHWEVEGVPGTVATNGVGAVSIFDATLCNFGRFTFHSVPQGFSIAAGTDCVVGDIDGDGFRGYQVATRSGTAGSALVMVACTRCRFGDVSGTNVWKPLVYLSVGSGVGLNPNTEVTIGDISAVCAVESGQAMALAVRSANGVNIRTVSAVNGIFGFKIGQETGDTALGIECERIDIGAVITRDQQSTASPSLIASGYVYNSSEEQKIKAVHIGYFVTSESRSYGWWMSNAEVSVGVMCFRGQHSTSVREQMALGDNCELRCDCLSFENQLVSGMVRLADASSLVCDVVYVRDQPVASLIVFQRSTVSTSSAEISVDSLILTGIPQERRESFSINIVLLFENLPITNVYIKKIDKGSHRISLIARLKGISIVNIDKLVKGITFRPDERSLQQK